MQWWSRCSLNSCRIFHWRQNQERRGYYLNPSDNHHILAEALHYNKDTSLCKPKRTDLKFYMESFKKKSHSVYSADTCMNVIRWCAGLPGTYVSVAQACISFFVTYFLSAPVSPPSSHLEKWGVIFSFIWIFRTVDGIYWSFFYS